MPVVYLIHFDQKYHHAGHYVGWASFLQRRLGYHVRGLGSPLMLAVEKAGIKWQVARTWRGKSRVFERWLKNRKFPISMVCPLCEGPTAKNRGQLERMIRERGRVNRRRLRAAKASQQLDPRDGKVATHPGTAYQEKSAGSTLASR